MPSRPNLGITLFEFVTGGGWFRVDPHLVPSGGLLREGEAMALALAADLAALPEMQLTLFRDARLPPLQLPVATVVKIASEDDLQRALKATAQRGGAVVLIAPELDGHLLRCAGEFAAAGAARLGPTLDFLRLASDKHATATCLAAQKVPTPQGIYLAAREKIPADFPCPAVIKPCDGAGSDDITLLGGPAEAAVFIPRTRPMRLESFVPGLAASVALLCGPRGIFPLPPTRQVLSTDGRFTYYGGQFPLSPELADRATHLAKCAVGALGGARGYVGVDLVLGDDPGGAGDAVIEVNPRLTTSYVGLRAAFRGNLAAAMLAIAEGRHVDLLFDDIIVRFTSDGTVETSTAR